MTISKKINLTISISLLLLAVSILLTAQYYSKKALINEAENRLLLLSKLNGQKVEAQMHEIEILTDNIIQLVKSTISLDTVKNNNNEMTKFENLILPYMKNMVIAGSTRSAWIIFDSKVIPGGNGISVFDKNNNGNPTRLAEYDINSLDLNSSDNAWWSEAVKNGIYWTDPYYWDPWEATLVSYSKKVEIDGIFLGVSGSDFIFDTFESELKNIKIYDSGYMFLINKHGNKIYHPDENFTSLKNYKNGIFSDLSNKISNNNFSNGVFTYKENGKKKIIAAYKLKNGWTIIAVPKMNEMYAEINSMSKKILVLAFVLIIIFIVIGIFISLSISRLLHSVIKKLDKGSDEVYAASTDLESSSFTLSEASSEQASSIEETASTLSETSSMIKQSTKNTEKATSVSNEIKTEAENGNIEMKEMVDSMEAIKLSSNEISKIIKVIDDIAFQTNILALNAAVEAARAGEQGAGFAVVAEEVRSLASRSAEAAKSTASIIETSVVRSEKAYEIAGKVAEILSSIHDKTMISDDIINEINSASQEQSLGVSQINQAISQIEVSTENISHSAEDASKSSQNLKNQAELLKKIVSELIKLVSK